MLPQSFPPVSTVRGYYYTWRDAGLIESINTVLVMNLREIEGREASPCAGPIAKRGQPYSITASVELLRKSGSLHTSVLVRLSV